MKPSRVLRLGLLVSCLESVWGTPVDQKEKLFALKYLKEYHYLSPLKSGNHNFKDALRIFQQNSDIPDTGLLDAKTITEMRKPRCGVPDFDEGGSSINSERKKRFSVSETFWTTFQLTYKFHNYASKGGLTPAKQRSIVLKAFKQWENISPFSFSDVTGSSSSPDITISFFAKGHGSCPFPFDNVGQDLAHAFFPEVGTVHFDDDETFTDGTPNGINLFSVALHEIGHLLGLKHSLHAAAIMHSIYKAYDPNMQLTNDDKNGIDYIYAQGNVTPGSTPSPCSDKHPGCIASQSYCDNVGLIGDSMRRICSKTCGQCDGSGVVAPCQDAVPQFLCAYYKGQSLCSKINAYVFANCKKTCNFCSAG